MYGNDFNDYTSVMAQEVEVGVIKITDKIRVLNGSRNLNIDFVDLSFHLIGLLSFYSS